MSKKMIAIAFTHGGHIPADIAQTKDKKDLPVGPHTAVNVPETYGISLIADRLAYAWDDDAKKAAAKRQKAAGGFALDMEQIHEQAASIIADANTEASSIKEAAMLEADKIIATANLSAQLIAAQSELVSAQTDDDKAAAQKMVDDAQLAMKQAEQ